MQKVTPFLWFNDNAEEAVNFYVALFDDSRILNISRYGEGTPMPAGSVMTVDFELFGQHFIALNGGPHFSFTEAISFMIHCETQEEIDRYWNALTAGGTEIQCGWLKDKYGLAWQIVPKMFGELMAKGDQERNNRMMQALMGMVKLDIAALKKAYEEG